MPNFSPATLAANERSAIKLGVMESIVRSKGPLGALFILAVSGAGVVAILGVQPKLIGLVQLCLVPLFLVLIGVLSLGGVKLPRAVLGLSAIWAVWCGIIGYSDIGLPPGAVEIAPFSNDPLQSSTRIFRDKVRRLWGEPASGLVAVGTRGVASRTEAFHRLNERPLTAGVLWEESSHLNVLMRPSEPISLRVFSSGSVAVRYMDEWGISDLKVITQLPVFGLSPVANDATYEFTARLLRALRDLPSALGVKEGSAKFEHDLRIAAGMKGAWRSMDHVAIPKLVLGNHYLVRAVSGPQLEWGDLMCAASSFESARAFLANRRDLTLLSIIINNEAILKAFQAEHSVSGPGLYQKARRSLAAAVRFRQRVREEDWNGKIWGAIDQNHQAFRDAIGVGLPRVSRR